jgi:hypothetical protein
MHDVLIPAWIRDLKAQEENQERNRREYRMAESLIRSETPKLWDKFVHQLAYQIEACKQLSSVRNQRFDDFRQENPPDEACKVTISGNTPFGDLLTTTVRLKMGSMVPYIDCLRDAEDHGKDYRIHFRVNVLREVVLVTPNGDATPDKAAEYVVKTMIRDVNKPF